MCAKPRGHQRVIILKVVFGRLSTQVYTKTQLASFLAYNGYVTDAEAFKNTCTRLCILGWDAYTSTALNF